jgi:hypothetical protein
LQAFIAFRNASDHFEGLSTFIASIFIYRHTTLRDLFFPFPSILDITDARQSGPDAELGENIDINEKPHPDDGKDEN